jgi:hypothetical protein
MQRFLAKISKKTKKQPTPPQPISSSIAREDDHGLKLIYAGKAPCVEYFRTLILHL